MAMIMAAVLGGVSYSFRWSDGMWIDVGYIENESTYYITTVSDDTLESWNDPLSVLKATNRKDLINILQQEIFRCRK